MKKGFTLVEMVVVTSILGVITLVAAPKFIGHTTEAKLAQIKSEIKAYEQQITADLTKDDTQIKTWVIIPLEDLEEMNNSDKVVDKKGNLAPELEETNYIITEELDINSKLPGDFIWTSDETVVYYDENLKIPLNEKEDSSGGNSSNVTQNGNSVEQGDGNKGNQKEPLEYTPETDFTWVVDGSGYDTVENPSFKGYYKYTGTDETVVIPPTIKGTELTSYYKMFYQDTTDNTVPTVKKVVSTNTNVTNTGTMFMNSKITELDLSELDTSNVTDMRGMFSNSKIQSFDLASFDTSKVTNMNLMFSETVASSIDASKMDTSNVINMNSMFRTAQAKTITLGGKFDTSQVKDMNAMFNASQATSLDLSGFNTSNVTNMSYMFASSKALTLDLSSFDTSKVTTMGSMFSDAAATSLDLSSFNTSNVSTMGLMFYKSKAPVLDLSTFDTSKLTMMGLLGGMFGESVTTKGYARTATDATKLNGTMAKPAGLTFVVKP